MELEDLIKAAVADGEITTQERAVLHRKAQSLGMDTDELDVLLEARLYERKKEMSAQSAQVAPAATPQNKNSKQGGMIKCPSCGAIVPSMTAVCSECGHEFRNVEAVGSAQKFFEALQALEMRRSQKGTMSSLVQAKAFEAEKLNLIRTFPVPNSKEDLMEMLAMAASNAYDNDGVVGQLEEAWLQKTDQIYQKIVLVMSNDEAGLKKATTLVTSLMRRLPRKYKKFTNLPTSMVSYAQEELAENNRQMNQYRKEQAVKMLKGYQSFLGPALLLLSIILMACGVEAASIGVLVGVIFTYKLCKNLLRLRDATGIYD